MEQRTVFMRFRFLLHNEARSPLLTSPLVEPKEQLNSNPSEMASPTVISSEAIFNGLVIKCHIWPVYDNFSCDVRPPISEKQIQIPIYAQSESKSSQTFMIGHVLWIYSISEHPFLST